MSKIYENEIGKVFRIDTGFDLTDCIVAKLFVYTPNGERQWTDVKITEGKSEYSETEGLTIIEYTTKIGDLTPAGSWAIMAYAEWSDGSKHYGEPARFTVLKKWQS